MATGKSEGNQLSGVVKGNRRLYSTSILVAVTKLTGQDLELSVPGRGWNSWEQAVRAALK